MDKNFPAHYQHLQKWMGKLGSEAPDTMQAFAHLHEAAAKDGALSNKIKELIALSIAVVVRCDGCIAYHVHDALETGASHKEVVEAIEMAILMGGGPAVVYGIEALEALEQFERANQVGSA